jgi:hypothetical protein
MSENFESTYEKSIPDNFSAVVGGDTVPVNFGLSGNDVITFGSRLPGGMSDQSYWDDDGISLTGNPYAAPDQLVLNPPNTFTLKTEPKPVTSSKNNLWKYNEDKILKDIEDYVVSTYGSHYCGHEQEYKDIQTIDLMAAKELASGFCQANIIKYGSRYGDKDGRSKRDLMKVIHYAMLLLHFDGHYSRKDNGLAEFSR